MDHIKNFHEAQRLYQESENKYNEAQVALLKECCLAIPTPKEAPKNMMLGAIEQTSALELSIMRRLVEVITFCMHSRKNDDWRVIITRDQGVNSETIPKLLTLIVKFARNWDIKISSHIDGDGSYVVYGKPALVPTVTNET